MVHLDDLIEMKRRAGRPQDLLDVEALLQIKQMQQNLPDHDQEEES